MHRFFINKDKIFKGGVTIDGEDVQHITKVLRLIENDQVTLCDGEGIDYLVKITYFDKNTVRTEIISKSKSLGEPDIEVVLYQGVPKSTKMDLIIEKCTELGITRIVPLDTIRTIVKLDTVKDERKKVDRWTKIAEEAAKQSGRGVIPVISMPMNMKEAIKDALNLNIAIIPYEFERKINIKEAIKIRKVDIVTKIGFFIGPEGGFEITEVELAKSCGIVPITLGPRILRTETAGLSVLSCIMYELNQMSYKD